MTPADFANDGCLVNSSNKYCPEKNPTLDGVTKITSRTILGPGVKTGPRAAMEVAGWNNPGGRISGVKHQPAVI
jgi:hypothetical protein